jgi:hypothetical protein
MSSWIFEGNLIEELPECIGFCYCITNTTNNRKYLGKKLSHFTKTSLKTVTLKSGVKKKKKVKSYPESDWRTYYGSCIELQNDVKSLGEENFYREILCFCYSKGELSYKESELQFRHQVLLSDDYYNRIISCRINASHLKII